VKEIQKMNKNGEKPNDLLEYADVPVVKKVDYENVVGQDDLTRFDRPKGGGGSSSKKRKKKGGSGGGGRDGQIPDGPRAAAAPTEVRSVNPAPRPAGANQGQQGQPGQPGQGGANRNKNRNRNRNRNKGGGGGAPQA
jgi:hypothetical protein